MSATGSVTQARAARTVHPAIARIADRVREAHAARAPRRIVGAGTWLDAGQPVGEGERLDVGAATGITEYVPGDLTLTALAGTTLAELHAATRANGQRLTLDPYGTAAGTLGATIATASAGPVAGAFGTPRDITLGLTMVTGTGDVVSAGGRVVKNVAGFDLVRLATGAWGTLGAIVEASVRLRALPPHDESFAIAVDADDAEGVAAALATLRALPFTFDALVLLDAATANALDVADAAHGALVARAADTGVLVHAMRAALGAVGQVRDVAPTLWDQLRALEPAGSATIRLSHAPSHGLDVWRVAHDVARGGEGQAHLAVDRTVARVTLPRRVDEGEADFAARVANLLRITMTDFDGTCIGERLPAGAWDAVPRPRSANDVLARLTTGVRDAFDPARILNPGILGAAGGDR